MLLEPRYLNYDNGLCIYAQDALCYNGVSVADPGSGRGGANIFPEILPMKWSEPILVWVQGPP